MERIRAWTAGHRKTIVAALTALISLATLKWGAGNTWIIAIVAVATVAGVYQVPNKNAAGAARSQAGTGLVTPPQVPVSTVPAAGKAGVPGAPPSAAPSGVAGAGQAGVTGGPPSA